MSSYKRFIGQKFIYINENLSNLYLDDPLPIADLYLSNSFFKWAKTGLFFFIFFIFTMQIQIWLLLIKAQMVCLILEPETAGWKAQTNPLSYGGTPIKQFNKVWNFHWAVGRRRMSFVMGRAR